MATVTNGEIIVAAIGLVSTVTVAVLSNWDKIRGGRIVEPYTGYTPSNDFEQELRIYLEIAGIRKLMEGMRTQIFNVIKAQLVTEDSSHMDLINREMSILEEEFLRYDEILQALLPTYSKYFNLSQIQQLNKFYSTQPMREMVDKLPRVQEDSAPIITSLSAKVQERLARHLRDVSERETPA